MSLVPGSALFAGQKNTYYAAGVILFIFGLCLLISAFLSSWSTDLFYLIIIVSVIIIISAMIALILTHKFSCREK